jgi:hypothetical protein
VFSLVIEHDQLEESELDVFQAEGFYFGDKIFHALWLERPATDADVVT